MGENRHREGVFRFKQFEVINMRSAMKVGTDGVLLGSWANARGSVLDAGAGTGLISLMIAQRCPDVSITALELDPEAADEAEINVSRSPWGARIAVVKGDYMKFSPGRKFDTIVSNPPFYATDLKSPSASRALARHGDDFTVETLIGRAPGLLSKGGRISLVTPADRRDDVLMATAFAGLNLSRETAIYTRAASSAPSRYLWEFVNGDSATVVSKLIIGSPDYHSLVDSYYL